MLSNQFCLPFARRRIRRCSLPDFDPAIKGRCVEQASRKVDVVIADPPIERNLANLTAALEKGYRLWEMHRRDGRLCQKAFSAQS